MYMHAYEELHPGVFILPKHNSLQQQMSQEVLVGVVFRFVIDQTRANNRPTN